ncbi:MAG: hypothetical protein LC739_08935 [Actinobacteria bacterium]|nr:hypothetical protein [Actinomycetota bacterium]
MTTSVCSRQRGSIRPSGYRYYRIGQANHAEAIRILRSVEMPIDEIKELLSNDSPDITRKLLDEHRRRLVERLAQQQRTLAFLEALIEREEGVMPYEVTIARVEPQPVAALRIRTSLQQAGETIGRGFGEVMSYLGKLGIAPAAAPLVIFHDVIDEETPAISRRAFQPRLPWLAKVTLSASNFLAVSWPPPCTTAHTVRSRLPITP